MEMVTVVRDIEALPVVTVLSPLATSSTNKLGYLVDPEREVLRVKNMGAQ